MNFVKRPPEVKYCLGCHKPLSPLPGSYQVSANRKWCAKCAAYRPKPKDTTQ